MRNGSGWSHMLTYMDIFSKFKVPDSKNDVDDIILEKSQMELTIE